jgi:hypothetical protein
MGLHSKGGLLALPPNIRLEWKGATTLRIMTLSIIGLFVTLGKNEIQHNAHSIHTIIELNFVMCRHAECRNDLNVMLTVVMLISILIVVMLNAVMISVLVPKWNLMAVANTLSYYGHIMFYCRAPR